MSRVMLRVIVLTLGLVAQAPAQTSFSGFTYQGELSQDGTPANGVYDLRFELQNLTVPSTNPTPVCVDNVQVVNGRFMVQLNFANVLNNTFSGGTITLRTSVRTDTGLACADPSGFTVLSPDQTITYTPYAAFSAVATQANTATNASNLNNQPASFYTNSANLTGTIADARLSTNVPRLNAANTYTATITAPTFTGALNGNATSASNAANASNLNGQAASFYLNAGNLNAGTIPSDRVSGTYSNALSLTNTSNAFAGTFTGNGAGITALSATNMTTGLLPDARISSNFPRVTTTNTFSADNTFLSQVGIGATNATTVPLWVERASSGSTIVNVSTVLALENSAAAYLQFFTPGASESGLLFGHSSPDPSTGAAIIYNNAAASQGLQFRAGGNSTRMTLTETGRLGIGTLAPEATLHVRSDDSLGTIIVTPGVADTQSQLLLAENTSASNAMMLRYNGVTNNLEVRGLAANVESPAHLIINRDNGNATFAGDVSIPVTRRSVWIGVNEFAIIFNGGLVWGDFATSMVNSDPFGGSCRAVATPHLPEGAVVQGVYLLADDTADVNANVEMRRFPYSNPNTLVSMASVSTSGTGGVQTRSDTSISSATISHQTHLYDLELTIPRPGEGALFVYGVRIEYDITKPLP